MCWTLALPPSTHGTSNNEGVLGHGGSPEQWNGGSGWYVGWNDASVERQSGRTRGRAAECEASLDSGSSNCASRCQDNSEKFSISNIVMNLDRRQSLTEEGAGVTPLVLGSQRETVHLPSQYNWLILVILVVLPYWFPVRQICVIKDKPTSGRVFCSGFPWTCDTYVTCWQVSQVC